MQRTPLTPPLTPPASQRVEKTPSGEFSGMNKRFLEFITEITVWSGTSQTGLGNV